MKAKLAGLLAASLLALAPCQGLGAITYYVRAVGGNDSNTGTGGWSTALSTLTNALKRATTNYQAAPATIYLSGGVNPHYVIASDRPPWTTNLVMIMGGFRAEDEDGMMGTNNPAQWPTVISPDPYSTVATNPLLLITATTNELQVKELVNITFQYGSNTQIVNNAMGGALCIKGVTNVLVRNCVFDSNIGARFGGAVHITNSTVVFTNCVFQANQVVEAGDGNGYGAAIAAFGGALKVQNSTFSANNSLATNQSYGMALYMVGVTNSLLRHNLFSDNQAQLAAEPRGMALYVNGGNVTMDLCNVVKHDNEAVCALSGGLHLRNSIFWNNAGATDAVGVASSNIRYSVLRTGLNNGTNGCTMADPLFADYDGNDFHVLSQQGRWNGAEWVLDPSNSPCIDRGDPASDFSAEPTPNGGRVNIGLYGNTPEASKSLTVPKLVVTPWSITNTVMRGQVPTNQAYTILASNSFNRAMIFSNVSQAAWLTIEPTTGTITNDGGTAIITSSYNTASFPVAAYTGRVVVSAQDLFGNACSNSPVTNRFIIRVRPDPVLALSTTNLTRTVAQGFDASPQSFEVWNEIYEYGLQYTISTSVPWMSVSPNSGSSYGEHDTITINFHTTNMTPGTYTGYVVVNATVIEYPGTQVTNAPMTIRVTLTVTSRAGLARTPAVLTNAVTMGYDAPMQTFEVWNNGPPPRVPMSYTVASGISWLSVDPTSGSSTGEHDTINVWYDTKTMMSGVYTGYATVTALGSATNSPQIVTVILSVTPVPELSVSTVSLTNQVTAGHDASAQSFEIWNSSDWPMGTINYQITNDATWFRVVPTNGTSSGEQDTITVLYSTANLANGPYHGTITAIGYDASTGAEVDRRIISVNLLVRAMPVAYASLVGLTNTVLENMAATNQSFTIWNGSADPVGYMSYVISANQPWLWPTPSSGLSMGEQDTIAVNYNAAALAPGVYNASLTVLAWDTDTGDAAVFSPLVLPVRLTVLSRTPVNYELPQISGLPYIGKTLTLSRGLWGPTHTLNYTQQWQRADNASGLNLANIPGASATNYTVRPEDAGKYIRAQVTVNDSSATPTLSASAASLFSSRFKIRAMPGDYNNDGQADLWFFDVPVGYWRILLSGSLAATNTQFGWYKTTPAPGDYDGDGRPDFAVYYQPEGLWYILTRSGRFMVWQFGWHSALPVPGDYDGDGATDLAVYGIPDGSWHILTAAGQYYMTYFGWSEATPVPGDYDGDGFTDFGVYHQASGRWYVVNPFGQILEWATEFGWADAMPAPGDYDGDGATQLAVYHQAGNTWYIRNADGSLTTISFGTSRGVGFPMQADFDGDGKCDPATVHAEVDLMVWCIMQSARGYLGHSYQFSTSRWR